MIVEYALVDAIVYVCDVGFDAVENCSICSAPSIRTEVVVVQG